MERCGDFGTDETQWRTEWDVKGNGERRDGCVAHWGRQQGRTVNVKQQSNVTGWPKEPSQDLLWPSEAFEFDSCVCACVADVFKAFCMALFIHQSWQSINCSAHWACAGKTVNPVEVLSDNPSYCSFLWILLICLSLYPSPPYFLYSLYPFSTNQKMPSLSSTGCFTYQSLIFYSISHPLS